MPAVKESSQESALNLCLVQTTTTWHDYVANEQHFSRLIKNVDDNIDIIVLPEMFASGFTMASKAVAQSMSGPTMQWLRKTAEQTEKVICGSLVVVENEQFFNRFVWVAPDGDVQHYDKRHRFRMAGEHEHYTEGTARKVIQYQGWRIAPIVCYDLRFPVWTRRVAAEFDYDLLLCVANWPAARLDAWTALLRARAIENQAYVAAVNLLGTDGNGVEYAGGSSAYTPDGAEIVAVVDEDCMLNVSLDLGAVRALRQAFPVWQDADEFDFPQAR